MSIGSVLPFEVSVMIRIPTLSAVFLTLFTNGVLFLSELHPVWAEDPPFKYVTTQAAPEFRTVVGVAISGDRRHAYTAAYGAKTIGVFSRDLKTGELTGIETIQDSNLLDCVTAARLSPDNRFLITAAFRSNAVVLYSRDAQTGKLTRVDSVKQGNNTKAQLNFAIEAAWSPDSKHAYVIAPTSAAVNVFAITAKPGLELVEVELGENRCFAGARGIVLSPDGKFVYVASEGADTLTTLKRDPKTGELDVLEILKHKDGQVQGLNGAFSLAVSPDGKFLYLSSGRFTGTDGITVFKRKKDGKLEFVDELINFTDKLQRFVGGNEIVMSSDGKQVYVVASRSDSLVVLDRDQQTGKLKQTQFFVDQFRGVGAMLMPGGLTISPDDKFIYVAAEGSNAVAIFQKNTPKPAIAEKPKN